MFFLTSAELFEKGGPMMYLLLLCSLTVAAIAIDRFMLYRRASQGARALEAEVSKSLRGRKVNELAPAAEGQDNMVAYLVRTALDARAAGEDVPMALDAAYGEAAMLLRARLNYLSMIVTMAPLMGLLGTISGMIESFSIFNLQAGQPMAITGGIGEALIATATGLLVAIFSLVVHTYFAQRMDVMLTLLEKTMNTLQAGFAVVDGGNRHAS
ncbi:transporter, MotA/TolQ/ExbB proton channel family protein [Selenomonas artemidis F0399]|uniref:Transporter, MotA/TolQ/ExbB proton channel family protein n=4 Tax=Selenomonadaceae TaxID=1843491 RepID=E7N2U1_9FIRM|nr:transporter, MotA/TolQ/ExbB proton channel family protein [Selenomonas artemidis F0399]